MIILPAIDILDGQCVRLYKGDYNRSSIVADSAADTALKFKDSGAKYMHMVDLDGARSGKVVNGPLISSVVAASGLKVQVGGGIRNLQTARNYLDAGAHRIIIGSAALTNPQLVKDAVNNFGNEHVAVGIDARAGIVMTEGWLSSSGVTYIELAQQMSLAGVRYFIVTDIERDGTLGGISRGMLKEISGKIDAHIIASGGVKDIDDIIAAKEMGLYGAICGKSLYSGTLNLKQAILQAGEQG